MEYFYQGHVRLDWGFDNPNKTAALIACLALSCWLPSFIRPRNRFLFFLSLAGFLWFGYLLLETYSRGGFISLAVGLVPVMVHLFKYHQRVERISFIFGLLLLVGGSVYNESGSRTSLSYLRSDASAGNRIALYSQVPKMLSESPEGLGRGASGLHFRQYYQDLSRSERYRTLVNYHATLLTESPWWGRILYAGGWALLLAMLMPTGLSVNEGSYLVGLGVALCAFTANVFSTIGEAWQTWVPLVAVVLVIAIRRLMKRDYPSVILMGRMLALSLIMTACVHLYGIVDTDDESVHLGQGHLLMSNAE